jgi:hypothetical protein
MSQHLFETRLLVLPASAGTQELALYALDVDAIPALADATEFVPGAFRAWLQKVQASPAEKRACYRRVWQWSRLPVEAPPLPPFREGAAALANAPRVDFKGRQGYPMSMATAAWKP